jgi:hypothetical protein
MDLTKKVTFIYKYIFTQLTYVQVFDIFSLSFALSLSVVFFPGKRSLASFNAFLWNEPREKMCFNIPPIILNLMTPACQSWEPSTEIIFVTDFCQDVKLMPGCKFDDRRERERKKE